MKKKQLGQHWQCPKWPDGFGLLKGQKLTDLWETPMSVYSLILAECENVLMCENVL